MNTDDGTTVTSDRLADRDDMIVCVDVDKWYGDFHVLRDIYLEVKRGERIAICGPSGSGRRPASR